MNHRTAEQLIADAAQRAGVVLGKPEYLASPTGDYWCARMSNGAWVRFSADEFERESGECIVVRLVADLKLGANLVERLLDGGAP